MHTVITPAPTIDLTTLDAAKTELRVSGSAQDATILDLIRQASDAIADYCGQPFGRELVEQTEIDMGGRSALVLERTLAPAIESVTAGGSSLDASAWVLDGAILRFPGGHYGGHDGGHDGARYWGPVIVRYSAGFELVAGLPYAVERACLITVAAWYGARGRDPLLRGETVEGVGSFTYATPAAAAAGDSMLPGDAEKAVRRYRRIVL
jgi:hypothetical protein